MGAFSSAPTGAALLKGIFPRTNSQHYFVGEPSSLTSESWSKWNEPITITRLNGFASTVAFTASGLPTGVTASYSPQTTTTTGTSSILTLTASAPRPRKRDGHSYWNRRRITRTTTIALTVAAPPILTSVVSKSGELNSESRPLTALARSPSRALNEFASTVAFTASGLPTGVTASSIQTTTTTGTSSVLTLTASTTATLELRL